MNSEAKLFQFSLNVRENSVLIFDKFKEPIYGTKQSKFVYI